MVTSPYEWNILERHPPPQDVFSMFKFLSITSKEYNTTSCTGKCSAMLKCQHFYLNQTKISECIRAYFQKIECRRFLKRHPWKWIFVFRSSKGDRCTKASDNEPDEYFLLYMAVVFFSKSMTERMKPKCVATDHESFVVSITLLHVACIIYMHNINKGSQNFWVESSLNWFNSWILIFLSQSST